MNDKTNNVNALRNNDNFGLAQHYHHNFSATVSGALEKKDIENPKLWELVSNQLTPGDEVRVIAEDFSFYAQVLITYVKGTSVRAKVIYGVEMEKVDSNLSVPNSNYDIKLRGPKKWCIIKKDTGEVMEEMIADQATALKSLREFEQALMS